MTATLAVTTPMTSPSSVLPAGTLLDGRFEIVSLLGRGGMGAVYRAHDRTLDEPVAVKVMRSEFALDPRMAERFKSEIKLARRVRHRNVCAIHDYGEVDGTLYISMELVDGVDLKHRLGSGGALPRDEAYAMAIQIADGLHAVHECGIVHRDMKPSNVVCGQDGVVRLMDFGIAKRQSEARGITATGNVVGTPDYMSPEQAQGRPLDARSDVYALGVLVYELFTGNLPFHGDTPISTILKHIQEPPPLDGPAAAALPAPLRRVLKSALAKDPAERYADAGAMAAALRQARDAPDVEPPAPAPAARSVPLLGLAGAAAIAVAVAVVLIGRPGSSPSPEPPVPATLALPITEAPAPTPLPTPAATPAATAPPATESARAITVPPATRPTAAPTARPTALPTAAPPTTTVRAAPPPTTVPARPGQLHVVVRPWAEVAIDGRTVGETPLAPISLPAGRHTVVLRHPAWEPLELSVDVESGQSGRLVVDLAEKGRRR